MKIHTSDKAIAWITLFSGLTISAVAIYYSVAGLTAIFSAAIIPIIVMGVALEISKLAATVWLKQNWTRAPNFIRGYLLAAIAILMLITSMGIFGFLSKAHSDQSLVSGDVQSKIAIYDEKIKTEKENIEANRKALKQMDEAVDQVLGRSTDEKGADKAVALRRSQQKERGRLLSEISQSQKSIAELNEARAPIAAEVRKVEAEVGPIKYIANFIYGDNPDANVLEKAVTWVIIIIVIVFDPLAVILLLASQYSFMWFRQQKEESTEGDSPEKESDVVSTATVTEQATEEPAVEEQPVFKDIQQVSWMFPKHASINDYRVEDADEEFDIKDDGIVKQEKDPESVNRDPLFDERKPLDEWNEMIAAAEKAVQEEEDHEIIEQASHSEKEAMAKWKSENPDSSLKHQRKLLDRGMIQELPWLKYLKAQPDFSDDDAAEEAAKWAQEQLEKKKSGYVQNAEQSEKTIWQRVQDAKK